MTQMKFQENEVTAPATTDILLHIRLAHAPDATKDQAQAICRQALIDYAEAYELSVYRFDLQGKATTEIDDQRLIAAIEKNFTDQFLAAVSQRRQQKIVLELQKQMQRELSSNAG